MNIAIIPARKGSKRIPLKNIKTFAGKPLIAHSIQIAIKSGLFEEVVVSTDSEEIKEIAEEYGARVPFLRPSELSDDYTPTAPVLLHSLEWYRNKNQNFKYACCIYATAPLIQLDYLKKAYELISTKKVSSVFPVTSFPSSIFRALKINEEGRLLMFWPEHELTRSNDLPSAYYDAGQFYWFDCERFFKRPKIYNEDSLPLVLPQHLVQDIDTEEDLRRAELLFELLKKERADK